MHTRIYVCLEGELKFWENIYGLKDVSPQLYGMKIKSYVIPANSYESFYALKCANIFVSNPFVVRQTTMNSRSQDDIQWTINYTFQCLCNYTTLTNIYFSVELKQVYSYQHKHCLSLNRVSSLKLLVWPWWIDKNSGELKIQLITYQLYNKQNISYEKYLSLRRNFL